MPARTQVTPFGDVTITSRWMRDRYYLVATGPEAALRWMFPSRELRLDQIGSATYRTVFRPAPTPIRVERLLRQICARWQERWDNRYHDETQVVVGEAKTEPASPPATIAVIFRSYADLRAGELARSTRERNGHYMKAWERHLGPDRPLADLTEEVLVQARDAMVKTQHPATVNCQIGLLKTILRWAELRGFTVPVAYKGLRTLKVARNSRDKAWWTTAEVDLALVAAAEVDAELLEKARGSARRRKGDVVESPGTATLLIALGCLLGLRWEEMVMLEWKDIDLDATAGPVIHIVPKEGWMPKDAEARAAPIHDRLAGILRQFRRPEGWVLNPNRAVTKRGGTKRVYRYDPKKIWLRVLAVAMGKGAKEITPHGMRHSFASNLLMAGVSDVLVARWMGHADTKMVHLHYGHLLAYHADINKVRFGPSAPT